MSINLNELDIFIIKLLLHEKQAVNTFITKQAINKLNYNRYKVYRSLNKLKKYGFIKEIKISKRLRAFELTDTPKALDLINLASARNSSTTNAEALKTQNNNNKRTLIKNALRPRWHRINQFAKEASEKLFSSSTLTSEEQEELTELMELWLEDIKEKIIVLEDQNGDNYFLEYKTRFNSKSKALEILKKAEEAFNKAKSLYNFGIFLTVTIPPIFPQRIAMWILSFIIHRIKAFCFRKFKQRLPHIRVDEPQKSFYPHTHIIIFGADFLMYKNDLTFYLEKHLTNFLSSLGKHYKKTINKRADEETIQALNILGTIYLKRYYNYKNKNPKYQGPINWLTKIEVRNGEYTFNQAPPDIKTTKNKDGGMVTVFDYIKFYMVKNLNEAMNNDNSSSEGYKPSKIKNKALVWYWAHRRPFFFASPILRTTQRKPPPAGWKFIGAFNKHEIAEIFNVVI